MLRLVEWALEVGGLPGGGEGCKGGGGTELNRAGVWRGCVEGCLSKTSLAAVSLLQQELQGFRACMYRCASPAVRVDILELFPVTARTKTRAGSAPPFRRNEPG